MHTPKVTLCDYNKDIALLDGPNFMYVVAIIKALDKN